MIGEELHALLEPAIEQMGYELTDLEVRLGTRDGVLRVFIDKADGIGLDDCEAVIGRSVQCWMSKTRSRAIMCSRCRLQGSIGGSPKPSTFGVSRGADVRIKLRMPLDGRRNFRGAIGAVDDETVEVNVDGVWHTLPIVEIASARLVPAV